MASSSMSLSTPRAMVTLLYFTVFLNNEVHIYFPLDTHLSGQFWKVKLFTDVLHDVLVETHELLVFSGHFSHNLDI